MIERDGVEVVLCAFSLLGCELLVVFLSLLIRLSTQPNSNRMLTLSIHYLLLLHFQIPGGTYQRNSNVIDTEGLQFGYNSVRLRALVVDVAYNDLYTFYYIIHVTCNTRKIYAYFIVFSLFFVINFY